MIQMSFKRYRKLINQTEKTSYPALQEWPRELQAVRKSFIWKEKARGKGKGFLPAFPRACFIALLDLIPTDSRITTNQFPGGFMPLLVTFRNQVHFNVFVTMTTGSCNKKITVGFLIGSKYLEASKGKWNKNVKINESELKLCVSFVMEQSVFWGLLLC